MEIGYGECVTLRVRKQILTLVYWSTHYVWTYAMHNLSGADVIQALRNYVLMQNFPLPNSTLTLTSG